MAGLTPAHGQQLLEGSFSDLTLVCDDAEFHVHRSIGCTVSSVIKERCVTQKESSHIDLRDLSIRSAALARLLQHIYVGAYEDTGVPLLLKNRESANGSDGASEQAAVHETQANGDTMGSVTQLRSKESKPQASIPSDASTATSSESHTAPVLPTANSALQSTDSVNSVNTEYAPVLHFLGFGVPAQPQTDDFLHATKANVEVYICAKTLCVDSVMQVSREKAMASVNSIFTQAASITGFAPVLDLIYTSTRSGTDLLRQQVTRLCLAKCRQCSKNSAVAAVINEHEPMIWRVAVPILRGAIQERDAERKRVNSTVSACEQDVSCPNCSLESRVSVSPFGSGSFGTPFYNQPTVKVRCKTCISKSSKFEVGISSTPSSSIAAANRSIFSSAPFTASASSPATPLQKPSSQGGNVVGVHVGSGVGGGGGTR